MRDAISIVACRNPDWDEAQSPCGPGERPPPDPGPVLGPCVDELPASLPLLPSGFSILTMMTVAVPLAGVLRVLRLYIAHEDDGLPPANPPVWGVTITQAADYDPPQTIDAQHENPATDPLAQREVKVLIRESATIARTVEVFYLVDEPLFFGTYDIRWRVEDFDALTGSPVGVYEQYCTLVIDEFTQPNEAFSLNYPRLLEAHPTEDAVFLAVEGSGATGRVHRYKASTLELEWDVVAFPFAGQSTHQLARGMAYVPATDELWVWAIRLLKILDPATGAVLHTIDITTIASEGSPAYDEFTGAPYNGLVVGNLLYLTASDPERSVGNEDFSITVFDVTTRTKVAEGYFTNINSPQPRWFIDGRLYLFHTALMHAINPATLADVATSDHGFAPDFLGGTNSGPGGLIIARVYDPARDRFYLLDVLSGTPDLFHWSIVYREVESHPNLAGGGPHDPAHDYLPSTSAPGTEWSDISAVGSGLVWHAARAMLVLSCQRASDGLFYMALINPATIPGAVPTFGDAVETPEGVTTGALMKYNSTAQAVVGAWALSGHPLGYQTLLRNYV